jgi:hypothetical protein
MNIKGYKWPLGCRRPWPSLPAAVMQTTPAFKDPPRRACFLRGGYPPEAGKLRPAARRARVVTR